jgi:alpha/beta superfamily hydrolase
MTSYYLSRSGDAALKGFAVIDMPGGSKDPAMNSLVTPGKYNFPVLDLYGNEDHEQVLANVDSKRKVALSVSGGEFEQLKIDGANHFFDGQNETLIATVYHWLANH